MRTAVDIPEQDLKLLDQISKADKISRSEVVRRAIAAYVAPRKVKPTSDDSNLLAAFGIWKDRNIDGQEYQDQIRSEWDREWDR